MRLAAALAAVSILLGVSPALAQPGNTPPAPPPGPHAAPAPIWQPPAARRTKRYGTKIATVDGLSVAAVFAGALIFVANIEDSEDDGDAVLGGALMIGGGLGLFFGGPLVHNSEGNSSGAWKSLGLRVGAPLVASLIVAGAQDDCDPNYETCDDSGLESLPGLVFLGGMVIDWLVLAKVEVDVQPYVAPSPYGGGTVGLGGRF